MVVVSELLEIRCQQSKCLHSQYCSLQSITLEFYTSTKWYTDNICRKYRTSDDKMYKWHRNSFHHHFFRCD